MKPRVRWCLGGTVGGAGQYESPTGVRASYTGTALTRVTARCVMSPRFARRHPIVTLTSSIRPLYQSPPAAFAPIDRVAVLLIVPTVFVEV
jgi:hypothetical protein